MLGDSRPFHVVLLTNSLISVGTGVASFDVIVKDQLPDPIDFHPRQHVAISIGQVNQRVFPGTKASDMSGFAGSQLVSGVFEAEATRNCIISGS